MLVLYQCSTTWTLFTFCLSRSLVYHNHNRSRFVTEIRAEKLPYSSQAPPFQKPPLAATIASTRARAARFQLQPSIPVADIGKARTAHTHTLIAYANQLHRTASSSQCVVKSCEYQSSSSIAVGSSRIVYQHTQLKNSPSNTHIHIHIDTTHIPRQRERGSEENTPRSAITFFYPYTLS